jgi:hypothetical protein
LTKFNPTIDFLPMKNIWILSLALPLMLLAVACGDGADAPAEAPPTEEVAGPPPEGEDDGTGGTTNE